MKTSRIFRWALALFAAIGCSHAAAMLSCSLATSPLVSSGSYNPASNLDLQGSVSIQCSKDKRDKNKVTLWVGLGQSISESLSKPAPYPDALAYAVYADSQYSVRWTDGVVGGQELTLNFSGNTNIATASLPYYVRLPAGQADKSAGSYAGQLPITLRETDAVGEVLNSTSMRIEAAVAKVCAVDLAPLTYSMTYQAFRPTALVDTSKSVEVVCTKGTQVSLSLERGSGVIEPIGLSFGLALANGQTASGTSNTSAASQSFGLTLTLPGGQAGSCAAASCSGTVSRVIMVTY